MNKKYSTLLVCALLGLSALIAYWPVKDHDFTMLDDYHYVVDNPTVKKGVTYDGIICAFTPSCAVTEKSGHWHPLTWLSLMLDNELYGLKPGGYHVTNLLFHITNTLLLFLILNLMTQALWRSAFVAMLFALHPLHVESVAWVTERKDVLSAFFGFLALGAYAYYAKRPGIVRYGAVFFLFAFSLMTKSMLVTWPFVLLLIDYWPLKRFQQAGLPRNRPAAPPKPSPGKRQKKKNRNPVATEGMVVQGTVTPYEWPVIRRRIVEKIPLALLSLFTSALMYDTARRTGSLDTGIPLLFRIENALVSYAAYMRKMFWPDDLGIIYPYPDVISTWHILGSILVLAALTGLALRFAVRFPYLPVGWFWYIGTDTGDRSCSIGDPVDG